MAYRVDTDGTSVWLLVDGEPITQELLAAWADYEFAVCEVSHGSPLDCEP